MSICILCSTGFTTLAQSPNPDYNKALADSMGADEYGMKMYVLVILTKGTNTMEDKGARDSLFRGHRQNIGRLAKAGKLVVAGPIEENESGYEGIFILNVPTVKDAKPLLETDPAIQANLLGAKLYEWYGSAALAIYLPYHDKVSKTKF